MLIMSRVVRLSMVKLVFQCKLHGCPPVSYVKLSSENTLIIEKQKHFITTTSTIPPLPTVHRRLSHRAHRRPAAAAKGKRGVIGVFFLHQRHTTRAGGGGAPVSSTTSRVLKRLIHTHTQKMKKKSIFFLL